MTVQILTGDCRERLAEIAPGSIQCCVTSPPYHGLRAYGGNAGMIGLEPTIDAHIAALVDVFRGVWRVLRDDGTLWLNYGDAYAAGASGGSPSAKSTLLKPKDLIGLPWRIAFALQADGWYLRSAIVWHKPNPMPESVRDRPTSAYEHIFLLTKSPCYFYDAEAIKEPENASSKARYAYAAPDGRINRAGAYREASDGTDEHGVIKNLARTKNPVIPKDGKRNARNVWTIPTAGFAEAHFATFPPEIPRRCILAGSREGDTVLDPFSGAGTTGLVADRLGRNYIGIELNEQYAEMSRRRIIGDAPLFAEVESA